jgi:hypothetical protein
MSALASDISRWAFLFAVIGGSLPTGNTTMDADPLVPSL